MSLQPQNDDDGLLERIPRKLFGKSWKTTLMGIAGAFTIVIPMIPACPAWLQTVAQIGTALGFVGLGATAKAYDVSHTKP